MTHQLTDSDRAEIEYLYSKHTGPNTRKAKREAIAAHFYAKGIEDAAKACESGSFHSDSSPAYRFAQECAAAIRALAKD